MFSVNDHVVFGNHGICVIKAIGPLDLSIAERGRLYYTLEPLYAQKNTIYTPVDNEKSSLRRAITREDALELILAGATAVSVGTANFANPMVTMEIVDGIEQYMQMHGVADINELIGAVK